MFTHEQIWQGIDRLAKAHGYSASGLARKAGLDPTSFNKSKRISPDGKPRWPSTESISKVLHATQATMSDLFALIDHDAVAPEHMAAKTAEILIETKSVLFNTDEPFTLKSGRPSPVYVDCRRLISFPKERDILMDYAAGLLTREIGAESIDICAGGETAGIPYGAFIAERLQKPMIYVRKAPKGHGRMAQIEGVLPERGKPHVVLIEDLQTDGGSKKIFIDALRRAGVTVEHAFVVFHYGIFAASKANMKAMGIQLHALCTWWDVLEVAKEKKYFDEKTLAAVERFLNNPMGWMPKRN
jgi:orotate phosphoribosyltransferase